MTASARREYAAQIAISLFADTAELVLAPARALLRHEPDPGQEIPIQSILRQSRSAKASLARYGLVTAHGSLGNALARQL